MVIQASRPLDTKVNPTIGTLILLQTLQSLTNYEYIQKYVSELARVALDDTRLAHAHYATKRRRIPTPHSRL